MKGLLLPIVIALASAPPASAESVVAARTIRSQTILQASDFVLSDEDTLGGVRAIADLVGLEARVVLYQGRPVMAEDVGPAAIVERNQIVTLVFSNGGLLIQADGRALGRAAPGEMLKTMNLSSRKTVVGIVDDAGNVVVGARLSDMSR